MTLSITSGSPWRVSNSEWGASLKHVDELLSNVDPRHRSRCANVLLGRNQPGWAQAWQDWLLYRNFFAGQRRGLYIDIGTNEPVRISNTFFFDECLKWHGVCFEPQHQYHLKIRNQRTCKLVPHCVLGRAKNVTMRRVGLDGSTSQLSESGNSNTTTSEVACVGMRDELKQLGLHNERVDLLTIDIEGQEPSVLRCFPFETVDVRLVLIETDKADLRQVDAFFAQHGFANVASPLRYSRPTRSAVFLDSIYLKLPGGALVVPSGRTKCSRSELIQNPWCSAYLHWATAATSTGWAECLD
mmetsp:Transcript_33287/g.55012  ORF Transcript_33287/g.55012 Transcript_33287/m.55012 type:complete len:299 (-) Transcript_33287:211-1107(-)|eukprot:CAMPEP_0119306052 /NCGR_PEP_ID=MMETSP1333-20130426/6888_1 /TAXON_ID=418940 /ORGANISM="Scyphosphaera apsteinii, Strain RCC1455" /LENGTH=298 /DNA_ID=CAMNT_0007309263 /DNA_START=85 /DNA_END=981 /DNA_ORIENTATION=-